MLSKEEIEKKKYERIYLQEPIEEAINSIKGLIEEFYNFPNPQSVSIMNYEIKDIETVLKELERLQEENNKLKRANKTYINSIQSITPVLLEDYIEKDKIKEKIKRLIKKLQKPNNDRGEKDDDFYYGKIRIQI